MRIELTLLPPTRSRKMASTVKLSKTGNLRIDAEGSARMNIKHGDGLLIAQGGNHFYIAKNVLAREEGYPVRKATSKHSYTMYVQSKSLVEIRKMEPGNYNLGDSFHQDAATWFELVPAPKG